MTVHILFVGGPMDGTIHSIEDPGDQIEFATDRGDTWIGYAVYRKLRTEKAEGAVFRGTQGVWLYSTTRYEDREETT